MDKRLPSWFKQELPDDKALKMSSLLSEFCVNTVCREAKCPNQNYCFNNKKVTFMILGDSCTRNCRFCNVNKSTSAHLGVDNDEPGRISEAVRILGLNYVVITSVTRDDLSDGGASIFAKTIELIRKVNKDTKIEALIPDFKGRISSLRLLLDAEPDVVAHNIETVRRISRDLRPLSDYQLSLGILKRIKEINIRLYTKSSLILGLGETEAEVIEAMRDLRASFCDSLTLGQYLAPSIGHYPIKEFVNIEQFQKYHDIGLSLGFKAVLSGPLVRSSYKAEEVYKELNYV
ncbi:MAG: lipoyl synthase [Candidatus Omnitrophota bacterium]